MIAVDPRAILLPTDLDRARVIMRLRPFEAVAMVTHAQREAPREACGVLMTRPGTAALDRLLYQGDNSAPDPTRHYCLGPATIREIMHYAEQGGYKPLAIYHSHPQGEPFMSAGDRRDAQPSGSPLLPWMIYLVVSLTGTQQVATLTAQRWADDTQDYERIAVVLDL